MKRNLGVAAVVAVLAMITTNTRVHAGPACPPLGPCAGDPCPVLIQFDANSFAYETSYTRATFNSAIGSQLTIVGLITQFGVPLNFLDPNDPNKEYTFVMSGLTSAGTVTTINGPTTNYETDYSGGTFTIYEGSPRNSPDTEAEWSANPFGGALVPSSHQDGTAILTGELCGFHTGIAKTVVGPNTIFSGSFRSNYNFTNPNAPGDPPPGNLFNRVGEGVALLGGNWCAHLAGCTPANYSAHPNGKFDASRTTPARQSTWGKLKQLYR